MHAWGFVCGRVSVLESRLLAQDFFVSLAAQPRTEEILRQLQDTPLHEFVTPGAPWQDWSLVADQFFHARAMSLRENCPGPGVVDLFLLAGDYLNLKRALQGQGDYPFLPAVLTREQLLAVAGGDFAALPEPLRGELAARRDGVDDNGALDLALDGAYLRHLLAMADALGVPLVSACVREAALARAVVAVWRAMRARRPLRPVQEHLLPLEPWTVTVRDALAAAGPQEWPGLVRGAIGELIEQALQHAEDEQIPEFEQLAADYVLRMAWRGHAQVAGPERVFWYLTVLAAEVYNMKLVVVGRLNRIDANVLKRRLRECHG